MTAVLEKKRYPSDLSHKQWKIIEPFIPPAKHGGRPRKHSMKDILDAIWYKVKTGCQWRQLPNDYPPWRTVYEYFNNWSLDDTWLVVHDEIVKLVRKKKGKTSFHQLQLLTANLSKLRLQEKTKDMMAVRR